MSERNNRPPRAAAIHDLSGFGRCSLTVALPVLSAMGVQLSCLPTAVLSTHTGGFQGYTFRDLTADMQPFFRHWKQENFEFDAIYTGYLGSAEQIGLVEEFFSLFRTEKNLILVDPVMGDHGKLYSLYTPEMAEGMKRLCKKADVVERCIKEEVTAACTWEEPQTVLSVEDAYELLHDEVTLQWTERVVEQETIKPSTLYIDDDTLEKGKTKVSVKGTEGKLENMPGVNEYTPVIWTNRVGEGRVFVTTIGHWEALDRFNFITMLVRGTEWAASGEVTLERPNRKGDNRLKLFPYY